MAFLKGDTKGQVQKELEGLSGKVKLVLFTQKQDCQYCRESRMLLEEVASLSDKITLEGHDFKGEANVVQEYKVDRAPAIAVVGTKDTGIRFYGVPAGHKFVSLLDAIRMTSVGDSGLSQQSRELVKQLTVPVHIQVFITLGCSYCPKAVTMGHKLALESDGIVSDIVEASEFPQLASKYNVFAVPKVVINEKIQFEGGTTRTKLCATCDEGQVRDSSPCILTKLCD